MGKPPRRDAHRSRVALDVTDRRPAPREVGRPVSVVKRSGYGILFHRGVSLGVVDYVLAPPPLGRETRAIHLHAPYVQGESLRGEPLTLHLDSGEELDGYCQSVDPSSWLLFRERPPDEP